MNLFRSIVRLGITDELNYQAKREIVATNYISLILAGAILLLCLVKDILFVNAPYKFYWVIGACLFFLPLLLNGLLLTTISRLFLCAAPVFFIWFSFVTEILKQEVLEQSMFDGIAYFSTLGEFYSLSGPGQEAGRPC